MMFLHRRRIAGVITSTALALGLLTSISTAAVAAEVDVPQAPVLSVIASSETLPFTLTGGGDIEVAVLTGSQTVAQATWTPRSSLSLESYEGQTIRVLARAAGVSDPADYFDATYDVRDTYASGVLAGTPGNAPNAVHGNSPVYRSWAKQYSDYNPGPNVGPTWLSRSQENVGVDLPQEPFFSSNISEGATTNLVILGDGGTVTANFTSAIRDGAGADFAVFENGFRINNTVESDFLELAYVEVSSNGEDFVRFDSGTLNDTPAGAFGGLRGRDYGGVAGRDLGSYGTPFDLSTLKNRPEVRSGDVDLSAITKVRIVDITGSGDDLDSFGRPIYDPFGTADSGGFDLGGVAAINQVAPAITQVSASLTTAENASVYAKVTAGTRPNVVAFAEWATSPDFSDAFRRGTAWVSNSDEVTEVKLDMWGLERGTTYWYRVGLEDSSGTILTKNWTQFSMVNPFLITRTASYSYDDHAVVDLTVDGGTQSPKHQITLEYGDLWGQQPTSTTEARTITGDADETMRFRFDDLPSNAYTKFTAVVTNEAGKEVWRGTAAQVLVPGEKPRSDGPHVTSNDRRSADVYALAFPGTYGESDVYLEHTTDPEDSNAIVRSEALEVTGYELNETLTDLTPGQRYWVRVVIVPVEQEFAGGEAAEFAGDWVRFTSDAAGSSLGGVTASAITRATAKLSVEVTPGDFDRAVSVEYTSDPDLDDTVTSAPVTVASAGGARTLEFPLVKLATGTSYWYRAVSTVGDKVERSKWFRFNTDGRPAVKLPVSVPTGPAKAGRALRVTATGLEAGENYELSVGGIAVARGAADGAGRITRSVKVPVSLAEGRHRVVVTGAGPSRTGTANLTVVRAKKLGVTVRAKKVKRAKRQTVTVRGLAAGERVTVLVRGKRVSPGRAKANAKGVYRVTFKVGTKTGRSKITVRGLDATRKGAAAFIVRR